jgi:hypothetical protein
MFRTYKAVVSYIRGFLFLTWMEGVQAAMATRNLQPDQRKNREEWRLVSRRRRQLLKKTGKIEFTPY